mmetsp:Transcript_25610/g.55660  ORF Transcript_25610/g.55660 Transcript_25610/m.55660 type:complete len:304 (-) Transcript_25610:266-1177(-)|eukprot:CAMPEP_0206473116 /NCGR_PEP_ID=MMETSP0324_2-20121206/32646_1 /ASSEMBLY_ACC=CAM_ASM_000836 /TAXON_ID=2866 /ORGANISM="Crypthecodinium cohnii, Strain Seligo" /LENGTH=303 /DNA_ID=CAMNT_0053947929 /DNA_START=130 /DNA_END=1041 /DNA_ORIENTATION=+
MVPFAIKNTFVHIEADEEGGEEEGSLNASKARPPCKTAPGDVLHGSFHLRREDEEDAVQSTSSPSPVWKQRLPRLMRRLMSKNATLPAALSQAAVKEPLGGSLASESLAGDTAIEGAPEVAPELRAPRPGSSGQCKTKSIAQAAETELNPTLTTAPTAATPPTRSMAAVPGSDQHHNSKSNSVATSAIAIAAAATAVAPIAGAAVLSSLGAEGHRTGRCIPCLMQVRWQAGRCPEPCRFGADCGRCHELHTEEELQRIQAKMRREKKRHGVAGAALLSAAYAQGKAAPIGAGASRMAGRSVVS